MEMECYWILCLVIVFIICLIKIPKMKQTRKEASDKVIALRRQGIDARLCEKCKGSGSTTWHDPCPKCRGAGYTFTPPPITKG